MTLIYRLSTIQLITALLILLSGVTGGSLAGTTTNALAATQMQANPSSEANTIPDSPAQTVSANQVLRFGVHVSGLGTLDPHFAAGSQDRAVADMLFNGLLRYQPGNAPQIEPDLALAIPQFEMVGGQQAWTFKLRRGVLFHPGPRNAAYELTADDVVYSLRKAADRQYSAYAGEYTGMTFEKVDEYTVRICLAQPLSAVLFLPKLTSYGGGFIVSQKAMEAMGYESYKAHPVGTGPFRFGEYQPDGRLTLHANETYFRGRPRLDKVEMHFVPDTQARTAGLRNGELDVVFGSGTPGWIEDLETTPEFIIDAIGVGEVTTLFLNAALGPLQDVRVRQAIAYALDREAFLNTTNRRLAGRVYSPVPAQFLPGGLDGPTVRQLGLAYETDRIRAKELLAQAGYPNGFTLDLVTSEKRIYRSCYEVLRRQLAQIGITCNIEVTGHSTMHRKIRQTPYPLVIYVAWRPNADVYLSRFFHSDSVIVTGARPDTNFSHYTQIDKLIEAARLEIDPQKQVNLWEQAQIRVLHEMVAYPLLFSHQCFARRSHVDYGHPLNSTMALYPQFTEQTRLRTPAVH